MSNAPSVDVNAELARELSTAGFPWWAIVLLVLIPLILAVVIWLLRPWRESFKTPVVLLLFAMLCLAGCTSVDKLSEQNLHRAWDVREQDKRPVVDDDIFNTMSPEQQAFHLPQSLDDARAFERDQAYKYEDSKK
jgi:thiol:disulfide interchange protein